jgi:hypothetical protein
LVFGNVAPPTFFDLAIKTLTAAVKRGEDSTVENGIQGIHYVNSLVSIIEAVVMGINFDIQYCQAPELVERCVEIFNSSRLLVVPNSI